MCFPAERACRKMIQVTSPREPHLLSNQSFRDIREGPQQILFALMRSMERDTYPGLSTLHYPRFAWLEQSRLTKLRHSNRSMACFGQCNTKHWLCRQG